MRMLIPTGWLMIVLGLVLGVGGIAAGQAVTASILLVSLAGSGAFMLWLAQGWDKPLDDAADLYKYGRPANAQVISVTDPQSGADGTRTANVKLHISPVNEKDYRSEQRVALPGGVEPVVGSTITVKFDPQSRRNFVLLEESFLVKDHITASSDALYGGLNKRP